MAQDVMSQAEIDALLAAVASGETAIDARISSNLSDEALYFNTHTRRFVRIGCESGIFVPRVLTEQGKLIQVNLMHSTPALAELLARVKIKE